MIVFLRGPAVLGAWALYPMIGALLFLRFLLPFFSRLPVLFQALSGRGCHVDSIDQFLNGTEHLVNGEPSRRLTDVFHGQVDDYDAALYYCWTDVSCMTRRANLTSHLAKSPW